MPLVSIIMNCYNSSQYLSEALDSVRAQTFQDYEIVFWDNQSTDDSAQIALSFGDKLHYFYGDVFLPLGAARNKAIEHAQGKYIAFLDCDDKWEPEKLEKQIGVLEANNDVDLLYTNYFLFEKKEQSIKRKIALKGKQPEGKVFQQFLYEYPVGMLTVMIRTASLKSLDHLFDAKLNLMEEYDLFMRLLYTGSAMYIDEPLAFYRIHANMTTITLKKDWPVELEYILNKYKEKYDQFEERYYDAILCNNRKIDYLRARTYLLDGNLIEARKHLKKCMFVSKKNMILYCATYMPKHVWLSLRPLWARGVFR